MSDIRKKFIAGLGNDELIEMMKEIGERISDPCDVITIQTDIDKHEFIELRNVLYIFHVKKKTEIYMKNGRCVLYPSHINNKEVNLIEYLEKKYDYFQLLMNGKLVNMSNITQYSTYYRKLYFSRDISLDVTGVAINYVSKIMGKEYDVDVSKVGDADKSHESLESKHKYFRFNLQ